MSPCLTARLRRLLSYQRKVVREVSAKNKATWYTREGWKAAKNDEDPTTMGKKPQTWCFSDGRVVQVYKDDSENQSKEAWTEEIKEVHETVHNWTLDESETAWMPDQMMDTYLRRAEAVYNPPKASSLTKESRQQSNVDISQGGLNGNWLLFRSLKRKPEQEILPEVGETIKDKHNSLLNDLVNLKIVHGLTTTRHCSALRRQMVKSWFLCMAACPRLVCIRGPFFHPHGRYIGH